MFNILRNGATQKHFCDVCGTEFAVGMFKIRNTENGHHGIVFQKFCPTCEKTNQLLSSDYEAQSWLSRSNNKRM